MLSLFILAYSSIPSPTPRLTVFPCPTHHPPDPAPEAFSSLGFFPSTTIVYRLPILPVLDAWWINVKARNGCVSTERRRLIHVPSDVY